MEKRDHIYNIGDRVIIIEDSPFSDIGILGDIGTIIDDNARCLNRILYTVHIDEHPRPILVSDLADCYDNMLISFFASESLMPLTEKYTKINQDLLRRKKIMTHVC